MVRITFIEDNNPAGSCSERVRAPGKDRQVQHRKALSPSDLFHHRRLHVDLREGGILDFLILRLLNGPTLCRSHSKNDGSRLFLSPIWTPPLGFGTLTGAFFARLSSN